MGKKKVSVEAGRGLAKSVAKVPGPPGYAAWLSDVKARVHAAQQRAALSVNREMLTLYWDIGKDLLERRSAGTWGDSVLNRVSEDLRTAFPGLKGFSPTNLKYMRMFAEAWPGSEFGQQPVDQLPWGHNVLLLTRLDTRDERLAYAASTLKYGWSRNVLALHIKTRSIERSGKAVTNFELTLPKADSDLARENLKDPYRFDFLEPRRERIGA